MNNRLKRVFGLLMTGMILAGGATGCADEITPKKIITAMGENIGGVTSFANDVTVDVKLESVVHITEACMELQMESTLEPKASHAQGTALVRLDDTKLESPMEIYYVTEDGGMATYSSLDQVWTKEVSGENNISTGITIDGDFLEKMEEVSDGFSLAEESVELGDKECYEMYGEMTVNDLKGLVGEEMLYGYGLIEIPEKDAVDELVIPVIFDVYKDELLPARIFVDMTDEMNVLYEEYGETMNVNDFTIDLKFLDYNQIEPIEVPEEVRKSVL
ncbi:MAG: hypothetical protein J5983_01945 [Ruminococcus sp.]|nr:hypothetical protein [Ruminococcus sp.]